MAVIDLTEHLDDIRCRFPEYWLSDEAQAELVALWGGVPCNPHGVIEPSETVRIERDGWHAEVRIARAPNGWHAVSTSYQYATGGGGSAPSIWNRTAYTERDEALDAGLDELIQAFEGVQDWNGSAPQSQTILAQRMIDLLKAKREALLQLALF